MCRTQTDDVKRSLAIAYLEDEVPESCKGLIRIGSQNPRVKEDIPIPEEILKLDSKTLKAILFIARTALLDKEAQDALQSTARYLGCKI